MDILSFYTLEDVASLLGYFFTSENSLLKPNTYIWDGNIYPIQDASLTKIDFLDNNTNKCNLFEIALQYKSNGKLFPSMAMVTVQDTFFSLRINDGQNRCYYLSNEWQDLLLQKYSEDYATYCINSAKDNISILKKLKRQNASNLDNSFVIDNSILSSENLICKCENFLENMKTKAYIEASDECQLL